MIRSTSPHILVGAQSHPGMSGKINEDRYGISHFQVSSSNTTPVAFGVVCDGIGGQKSGEVAADLAVTAILNTVTSSFGNQPLQTMLTAISIANNAIYCQAQEGQHLHGMGATVAMVWLEGDRLYTTSVGDSRIYLIRDHSIRQVTTDHTWVQEALENGKINKEQAQNHPNAHVIKRYLGAPVVPQADQRLNLRKEDTDASALANQGVHLWPDDSILLCSDGLTEHVNDKEIVEILNQHPMNNQSSVEAMVDLACNRGGKDNITIILFKLHDPKPKNFFQKLFS
jgi:PPM family protein phosphatase